VFAATTQEYLFQARQLQALSLGVHIPLVCFGVSLPAMVMYMEWRYLRTGDVLYRTIAQRWTRVMAALFAVGVVTGTILSFELGVLWPAFMSTFGGVFGLGFAIEGFSFFLEAIFIGIYIYGWRRLSPRAHFLTGIPVVIAGFTGSLTVITVNGWMNHPTGFTLRDGKAVDVDPVRALFGNSYFWHELVHMYVAGYMVAGFLLAAAYAFGRLRGRWGRYERTALAVPLTAAALAAPIQILVGDWNGRAVAERQPTKLAAFEGLGKTERGAPIHILGIYRNGEVDYGIRIPKLLSFLSYHDFNAETQGLEAVPSDQRPSDSTVNVVRFSFQTMVGIGTLLATISVLYFAALIRWRRIPEWVWFHRALVLSGPLALVALIAGWTVTEVGRQPWIVYRVMRTSEAVTHRGGIPVGYATLALVYAGLAVATWWILLRLSRVPVREV
jgi:cytochrome bd ubiquinol oxidase subunit I